MEEVNFENTWGEIILRRNLNFSFRLGDWPWMTLYYTHCSIFNLMLYPIPVQTVVPSDFDVDHRVSFMMYWKLVVDGSKWEGKVCLFGISLIVSYFKFTTKTLFLCMLTILVDWKKIKFKQCVETRLWSWFYCYKSLIWFLH